MNRAQAAEGRTSPQATELDGAALIVRRLNTSIDDLEAFCRRWHVLEFSLFGSVLRDDFGPDSDIDVLIVLDSRAAISLFDLVSMQDELVSIFGRDVDLVEKAALVNPYRRREILGHCELVYAA